MKLNLKTLVICLIIGAFIVLVGAFLKIMHLPLASLSLAIGTILEFVSTIAVVVLLLTGKLKLN